MGKWVVVAVGLLVCPIQAEAGVSDWVRNSYTYVSSNIGCVVQSAKNLIFPHQSNGELIDVIACVVGKANRNPATLNPLITLPGSSDSD